MLAVFATILMSAHYILFVPPSQYVCPPNLPLVYLSSLNVCPLYMDVCIICVSPLYVKYNLVSLSHQMSTCIVHCQW